MDEIYVSNAYQSKDERMLDLPQKWAVELPHL